MRVRIDSELCQGHQMCAILAPDVFDADEEGYGIVTGDGQVPTELEEDVRQAASSCPEGAVIVEETS